VAEDVSEEEEASKAEVAFKEAADLEEEVADFSALAVEAVYEVALDIADEATEISGPDSERREAFVAVAAFAEVVVFAQIWAGLAPEGRKKILATITATEANFPTLEEKISPHSSTAITEG